MNYYFSDGTTQHGPFPREELIAKGLRPEHLVWREGMVQWEKAGTVAELTGLFAEPSASAPIPPTPPMPGPAYGVPVVASDVSSTKVAAGICGILLGGFGVHKFILGMTMPGVIMLLVTLLTCGIGGIVMHVIGIVEGVIYLTKSDAEFYQTYVVGKKEWF